MHLFKIPNFIQSILFMFFSETYCIYFTFMLLFGYKNHFFTEKAYGTYR